MADRTPLHLRPTAPAASRVLLPGDPHRALAIAQAILDEPRMFNHTRGLWGYTGTARDGDPLTVQATGMGGPSAAIVVEELIDLGADTLLRVGTCGALTGGFALGQLVVAEAALSADGTSAALGATGAVEADAALTAALEAAGAARVRAATTDLFYDDRPDPAEEWVRDGAHVVEMEAATLLTVARRRGVRAGVLLGVTDLLDSGARQRASAEEVEGLGPSLGEAAWTALAASRPTR